MNNSTIIILKSILVTRALNGANIKDIKGDYVELEGEQLKICDEALEKKLMNINGVVTKVRNGQTIFFCSSEKTKHIANMVVKQRVCTKRKYNIKKSPFKNRPRFLNNNYTQFQHKIFSCGQNVGNESHGLVHSTVTSQKTCEMNVVEQYNMEERDSEDKTPKIQNYDNKVLLERNTFNNHKQYEPELIHHPVNNILSNDCVHSNAIEHQIEDQPVFRERSNMEYTTEMNISERWNMELSNSGDKINQTPNANLHNEAKICLSTTHQQILISRLGTEFLSNNCIRNKIVCRYEKENPKYLLISGIRQDRHNFHRDLKNYIKSTMNFKQKQENELAKQQIRQIQISSQINESAGEIVLAQTDVAQQTLVNTLSSKEHLNTFWSKMCLKVIKIGRPLFLGDVCALSKLEKISKKAENSLLSFNDCKSLIASFTKKHSLKV